MPQSRSSRLLLLALGSALASACSNPAPSGDAPDPGSTGTGGLASRGTGGSKGSSSGGTSGTRTGGQGAGAGGTSGAAGGQSGAGPAGSGGAGTSGGAGGGDGDAANPGIGDAAATGGTGGAPPAAGAHSKDIHLDTTAGGAGVMVDVPKYPVAVLLKADNFDFTQAKSNGEDIRFFTTDGQALPFEIEFWDATAKVAALWVKVDVKGNDNKQSFTMKWGDPNAVSASDSKAVFDTKDGFIGVWHLGEAGSVTPGGYKDATANEAAATGFAMTPDGTGPGRVGNAVLLVHSKAQWLEVPPDKSKLYENPTKMTYSIWLNAKSHTVEYTGIFTKSENGFRLHYYGLPSWPENRGRNIVEVCLDAPTDDCPLKGGNDAAYMGEDVKPGSWFHIVAIANQPKWGFYINGVFQAEDNVTGTWKVATEDVGIGTNTSSKAGRSFDGYLDEARILNVPKDANWAKLEYESQKEGQKFLTFGMAN